ncbi:uncharacterized protein LOC115961901 [Quercus lobata]|uniref:uncharacterized protein LOC115961901 n=1 Tax=Quercus lobata TaxID=97700 RepID=UPI0012470C92|nr:uncharacterized protein LOC115961901 [Quercus lobata]
MAQLQRMNARLDTLTNELCQVNTRVSRIARWFTMPEIDIIIYYGGPLKNANANKGLPFEGPGIKTYYTQIDRRLKTLDKLKMMVMEELCENPAMHNIHITYRMPNEILKHRINYKYMAIEADKHVKIMFDKLERIPEVINIELYIQLEPRAGVGIEEIQQTQTSLQVTVPDAQYEDEIEDRIEQGDFRDFERDIDDDETLDGSKPDAYNVLSVQNITNTIPMYSPPALSFSKNTWENMVDPSHIETPFVSSWREGMNLCKGLTFANKMEVQRVLTKCALKENKYFMISRSTTTKLCAKCVDESCTWYVCVVMKPKFHNLWMVTVYKGPHTCIRTRVRNDSRMMSCKFIADDILKKLYKDHTTPIKHLRSMIESKYEGKKPSYYKIWDAKQKAIGKMFGNWEESYQRLQKLLMAYIDQDPTTQVFYRTTSTGEDDTVFLNYVFWSFGPSIDGFKYCKPVISIDGTHLYGKYQGKLLVAMATDANNKIFPLAFAIVDSESGSSWRWFLQCLRDAIGRVIPNEGICIISDRHLSIKNTIANYPRRDDGRPLVFHRYCLRHVASNFNTHFQNSTLKSAALKAGYASQAVKFYTIMETIKQAEIEAIRNKKKLTGKDCKEKN